MAQGKNVLTDNQETEQVHTLFLLLFEENKLLDITVGEERDVYLAMLGISNSEVLCDGSITIARKSITASWVQVQLYELQYRT
jgi:hypothetical protein